MTNKYVSFTYDNYFLVITCHNSPLRMHIYSPHLSGIRFNDYILDKISERYIELDRIKNKSLKQMFKFRLKNNTEKALQTYICDDCIGIINEYLLYHEKEDQIKKIMKIFCP